MFEKIDHSNVGEIAFVQPAVPQYRVEFFRKLGEAKRVVIYTTEEDFLGVQSVLNFENTYYETSFKKFGPFYWHSKLPIKKILNRHSQIVLNGNLRILNYMLLLVLARFLGREVIWWGHLNSAGSYGFFSKIRQQVMKISSKRLFYTDNEKLRYKNKNKTYALNNGLTAPVNFELNSIINFSSAEYISLLFIGRLTEKSNILFALEALAKSEIPFVLHVIGDGPLRNGIDFFQNDSRFIFHGAIFNENEIGSIAKKCHLMLYPGSVGLSIIKGFGYGLPAVIHSNNLNHMPEFGASIENINSLYFKENDGESLIDTINAYFNLSARSKLELHRQARNTVKYSFNTNDMVRRMIECIDG